MACEYLHVLPLSLFILIPVTFVITLTLSVNLGHVGASIPYISETGTVSPESCIFAQFLNVAAVLLGCCVYIRHRQIEQWRSERGKLLINRSLVLITLWSGLLSCFGLDILANFQSASVFQMHMFGAMTCFSTGTLYFCLQTYVSQKMTTTINGRMIVWIRAGLSILSIILTTVTIVPGFISMQKFKGKEYKKLNSEDPGWGWHLTSAIAEWILAIVYCLFLLTFAPEFRLINIESPGITLMYLDKKQYDLPVSPTQETTLQEV